MRVLGEAGVPAGAIFDTMELTEDADFERRGIMQTMEHADDEGENDRGLTAPPVRSSSANTLHGSSALSFHLSGYP